MAGFPNVDGFIGAIISADKATLYELKTVYDLEDAYDMWEVITVNKYNEHLAYKRSQQR